MMAVRRQVGQVILHGRISCGVGTICAICRKIVQPKMPPALERFGLAGRIDGDWVGSGMGGLPCL